MTIEKPLFLSWGEAYKVTEACGRCGILKLAYDVFCDRCDLLTRPMKKDGWRPSEPEENDE